MCNYKKLLCLFLGVTSSSHAVVTGSNTVVSRQSAVALFPYSDTNNQLLGFTAAQPGIVLGRSDVTALYTSFFPISNTVDLRSGGLFLNYDLTLDQSVNFLSTGSLVAAGGSAIFLPPLTTNLGFPAAKNLLFFNAAATQATAPVSADWAFDSTYLANAGAATTATVQIYNFNGSTLTAATSRAQSGVVVTVRWHPSLYYIAVAQSAGGGNRLNTYLFTPPATLSAATGGIGGAVVYSAIAFSPNGLNLAYAFGTSVAVASFNTGTGAIAIVGGALGVTNTVSAEALEWIDNSYFVAGLNGGAQLRVYNFAAATPTQAATSTPGFTVTAVAPARFGGYIGVGLTGSTSNIRIYQFTPPATLTQVTLATPINESLAVNSMDWSPTGSFLSVGLATSSTASQIRVYYFDPTSLTLTLTGQVSSPSPTQNDIRWSPNSQRLVTADSNVSGSAAFLRAVSVYTLLNESTPFVLYNTKMVMNSDVLMGAPITFQGNCCIEGNDNVLDVSAINNFSIASTSTLLLKNMTLQGIFNNKINFVDNTGVLQLQDVTWVQTNTYNFTTGALRIQNSVLFTGTTPFIYQSTQPLTINANSTLMFDSGMTFSYAPSSSANNLIRMTDQTSIVYFNTTNLFASAVGMQLTKGTLVIDGPCSVTSSALNSSQGISFGDGASAANNCTVKILPESGFILNSGFLVQNNV